MLANTLLLSLREIRRNVLRSSLTILGIVIGVAAVIIMVTIGNGATVQVQEQIGSLGSNLLMIHVGQHRGGGQTGQSQPFTVADAQAVLREIPAITAVAPSSSRKVTAVYGNANWSTSATGVDNQFFTVRNWTIQNGRPFLDTELRSGKAVCIIGATVHRELFGRQNPLDGDFRLGNFSCRVIGVLEAKGQSTFGSDQDDLVLVPLRTFQRRIAGNNAVSPEIEISDPSRFRWQKVVQRTRPKAISNPYCGNAATYPARKMMISG